MEKNDCEHGVKRFTAITETQGMNQGIPNEGENKVRLGLPRIIATKENASECDYSSFYGKTGAPP
jgi:hypothetical protein